MCISSRSRQYPGRRVPGGGAWHGGYRIRIGPRHKFNPGEVILVTEQATLDKPGSELPLPFPLFLEITASSLKPGGYPIEAAWSRPDGRIESRLVNPSRVPSWTVWDAESEYTHGISEESLRLFGKSPRWLAERMNATLVGTTLYTNDASCACYLLHRLFETTGIRPSFTLDDARSLYRRYLSPETLIQLCTQAWRSVPHRHRAALEITYHRVLWNLIMERCDHSLGSPRDPWHIPPQPILRWARDFSRTFGEVKKQMTQKCHRREISVKHKARMLHPYYPDAD